MLTADLVSARRRGGDLHLTATDPARRARIEALAGALGAVARANIGQSRAELEEALDGAVESMSGDARLAAAVRKLILDACVFEESDPEAAIALRRDLFRRAAAARRAATPTAPFDRAALVTPDVEARLYGDRAGAQRLLRVEATAPARLAASFALLEAQAVLLRATRLRAAVRAREASSYRHLFRKLKFLRLLPTITRDPEGGYRLELDGPFSLFQGSTRYGLQLGLALPALAACDVWSIDADLLWGAERRPLRFCLEGADNSDPRTAREGLGVPPLPDEISALVTAFERLESGWRVDLEPAILDLPGAGLCVPDVAFVRARDGARVHFELLGFWSRDAVWRRVELVRAGLPHRILFAVSRSLRVGEVVLDDSPGAALYLFARVLNAKEILARLDRLADSG